MVAISYIELFLFHKSVKAISKNWHEATAGCPSCIDQLCQTLKEKFVHPLRQQHFHVLGMLYADSV